MGFGLQYSFKFDNCLVELKPFRIYKKPIHIRWYPELTASVGAMNLANESFRISGLHQTDKFNFFVQYGIGWNFYINSWLHLSIMYLQEYLPSLNNDPYRFGPLQTKLVFKLWANGFLDYSYLSDARPNFRPKINLNTNIM